MDDHYYRKFQDQQQPGNERKLRDALWAARRVFPSLTAHDLLDLLIAAAARSGAIESLMEQIQEQTVKLKAE